MTPIDSDPTCGQRLARLRREHGWTQMRLAEQLGAAEPEIERVQRESVARTIKRHEAGGPVSWQYQRAYSRVLGLSEDELFGVYAADRDGEERLAAGLARPSRLDTSAIAHLGRILHDQRRLEDTIGSTSLRGPVDAQLQSIEHLVTESRGAARPQLLAVASQWCQFAAWLAANTRQFRRAEQLYDRTITWATEANDRTMIATALNMRGYVAWRAHRANDMITRSESARRIQHISPGVRALATQQAARGHAIRGDVRATDWLLHVAADLIASAAENPAAEPPWIYFFDPAYFALQRGRAYLYLPDRHVEVITLLTAGIDAIPAEVRYSEWIGSYFIDLANAYHAIHEYGQADRVIAEALTIAEHTGARDLCMRARSQAARNRAQSR